MHTTMAISEAQFETWARPPSETEEGRCDNALRVISEALREKFGDQVLVFLKGSYKNRTNVREDSDVDLGVKHNDVYFPDTFSLSDREKWVYERISTNSTYLFSQFKSEVHQVLVARFGASEAIRRNKCILVKANSYRVNADVVPCFTYKKFRSPTEVSAEGIKSIADDGRAFDSFPDQHYANGVSKNARTQRMYKSVTRILKNVRNELLDLRQIDKKLMPSFFLECLTWNVPDPLFTANSYKEATRNIMLRLWNDMGNLVISQEYAEISNLKGLFEGHPQRTPEQVRSFLQNAWSFLGYEG